MGQVIDFPQVYRQPEMADQACKKWLKDAPSTLTDIVAVAAIAASAVFIPFAAWWVL